MKIEARPGSPNWHWQQLNCTIERGERNRRIIRREDGSIVDTTRREGEDGFAAEFRAAAEEYAARNIIPTH